MPFLESMDWALPTWACVSLRGVAQRVSEALLNPQSPPPGRWVALGPLVGGTLGEPVRRNRARGFGGEHGCWVPCLLWALAEGESLSQPPSLSCFLEPFCARERWRLVGWRCTLFLARWRNHGPSGPTRVHAHGIQSSVGQGRLMRGVCSGDRRRQEEGARRVGCVGGHAAHQDVSSRCSVRVCVGCKCACGRVAPLGRERLGG
jgi:hypothetical protein